MKNRIATLFLLGTSLLGSSLVLSMSSCHRDDDNSPDPCLTAKANPLTFRFLEHTGTPTPDTTYNNQLITLAGPGAPYTSYEWRIGAVDERTGQNVGVSFDTKTIGPIPVRLIARRPPNTACFKNDDGIDTLTQVLTLVRYVHSAHLSGLEPFLPERPRR
jgi:hypothetical protein